MMNFWHFLVGYFLGIGVVTLAVVVFNLPEWWGLTLLLALIYGTLIMKVYEN